MPQSSTNPVFVYDDAGRVADANEAAAVLADIPLPKLRRMHLRDFFHPDELPITEELMRSLRPGEEQRFERWFRCCSGRYDRVTALVTRRTIGGYRAEYIPLSGKAVELPSRLDAATPESSSGGDQ